MSSYKKRTVLLDEAEATGAGATYAKEQDRATFQATLDLVSTTPAATVAIEVSNDGVGWLTMRTLTLSGVGDTKGFVSDAPWYLVRANVTAISDGGGTAKVTVTMGT